MSELTHETELVQQALNALMQQYKGDEVLEGIISSWVGQIQEIEDAAQVLYRLLDLDSQEGAQLDLVGRIIKRPRDGLSDVQYRPVLRAWMRANRANGRGDDVIDVAGLALGITPNTATIAFDEYFPASYVVDLLTQLTLDPVVLAQVLDRAGGGGIQGQLVYSEDPETEAFLFGTDAEEDSVDQGLAEDNDETDDGGYLADVEEI